MGKAETNYQGQTFKTRLAQNQPSRFFQDLWERYFQVLFFKYNFRFFFQSFRDLSLFKILLFDETLFIPFFCLCSKTVCNLETWNFLYLQLNVLQLTQIIIIKFLIYGVTVIFFYCVTMSLLVPSLFWYFL